MADDFTGVPAGEWQRLRDRVNLYGDLLWLIAVVLVLLIWKLIDTGTLSSWADLFMFRAVPSG